MRKLTILILVVVMVLGLMLLAVGARGPANKVTGEIWIEVFLNDGTLIQESYSEFVAFERDDNKGYISMRTWTVGRDEVEIHLEVPVLCCNVVDKNTAWFAWGTEDLGCTVVKVVDGGSPGDPNDEIYFESFDELDNVCDMVTGETELSMEEYIVVIVGGNIVVHYYGE